METASHAVGVLEDVCRKVTVAGQYETVVLLLTDASGDSVLMIERVRAITWLLSDAYQQMM